MINGAIFNNYNSRVNYNSIMNYARITPPVQKTVYVDIAGGNSSIDLSEAVGGKVYNDATIEFMFTFFKREYMQQMKDNLHGKYFDKIVLEEDPHYRYKGRVAVTSEGRNGSVYELKATATVYPYKIELQESEHTEDATGKPHDIFLTNGAMPVSPRMTVNGSVLVQHETGQWVLQNGVYEVPEFLLYEGINRVTLSGNGFITFNYHKGAIV